MLAKRRLHILSYITYACKHFSFNKSVTEFVVAGLSDAASTICICLCYVSLLHNTGRCIFRGKIMHECFSTSAVFPAKNPTN